MYFKKYNISPSSFTNRKTDFFQQFNLDIQHSVYYTLKAVCNTILETNLCGNKRYLMFSTQFVIFAMHLQSAASSYLLLLVDKMLVGE